MCEENGFYDESNDKIRIKLEFFINKQKEDEYNLTYDEQDPSFNRNDLSDNEEY